MRFIDTNVFLRLLTGDHPQKAEACLKMFRRALEKQEPLFTSDLVIAEIIWVLEGFYHLKKEDIVDKMEKILNTPNLHCQNKKLLQECLILYLEKDIDFIDAYHAVLMKKNKIEAIYTYGKDFRSISWITSREPA